MIQEINERKRLEHLKEVIKVFKYRQYVKIPTKTKMMKDLGTVEKIVEKDIEMPVLSADVIIMIMTEKIHSELC